MVSNLEVESAEPTSVAEWRARGRPSHRLAVRVVDDAKLVANILGGGPAHAGKSKGIRAVRRDHGRYEIRVPNRSAGEQTLSIGDLLSEYRVRNQAPISAGPVKETAVPARRGSAPPPAVRPHDGRGTRARPIRKCNGPGRVAWTASCRIASLAPLRTCRTDRIRLFGHWQPYLDVIRDKCSQALHILDRFRDPRTQRYAARVRHTLTGRRAAFASPPRTPYPRIESLNDPDGVRACKPCGYTGPCRRGV